MSRPPTRKKGAYTRAEIQKRYRQRQKRLLPTIKALRKREHRAKLEQQQAERASVLAAELEVMPRRGVIYADPPWRFEPYSRETGMDRAADNHYSTMTLDEIKALPVPAADDCVLFLWATAPMLLEALQVIDAWGFVYRTHFIWAKDKIGTGYWNRNKHELLLIATRGNPVAPAPGEQSPSLIESARGRHSEKPEIFAEMIEKLWPNTPKLDMFARKPRPGWDSWGAEVEEGPISPLLLADAPCGRA